MQLFHATHHYPRQLLRRTRNLRYGLHSIASILGGHHQELVSQLIRLVADTLQGAVQGVKVGGKFIKQLCKEWTRS